MSWKTQSKAAQRQLVEQSQKALMPRSMNGNFGNYGNYQVPTKFGAVLRSNFMNSEIAPDPMLVRSIYPIMLWAIPQLAATLDMLVRIMGIPEMESKDAAFMKDVEQWLAEIIWKGEMSFPYDSRKGAASFIYHLAANTMVMGQSFITAMDSSGNQVQKTSQQIAFWRLHDSMRFNYVNVNVDEMQLTYERGGQVFTDVQETPFRQSLRFKTNCRFGHWGEQSLYGCEMDVTAALMAMEAKKANDYRVSNPSTILLGSFDPMKVDAESGAGVIEDMQLRMSEGESKMEAAKKEYMAKTQQQNMTGTPYNAFEFMWGGKADFKEIVLGMGIRPSDPYEKSVLPHIANAVVGMGGVPDFVGIQTMTGGGIGSDQHAQATARMEGTATSYRQTSEPILNWMLANDFLRKVKRIPADAKWAWKGLAISNEKARADIAKVWADTQKVHIETLTQIANEIGPDAANQYSLKNELGYKVPKTLPTPPTPPMA